LRIKTRLRNLIFYLIGDPSGKDIITLETCEAGVHTEHTVVEIKFCDSCNIIWCKYEIEDFHVFFHILLMLWIDTVSTWNDNCSSLYSPVQHNLDF